MRSLQDAAHSFAAEGEAFLGAKSFSAIRESLKPRHLPWANLKINCFWGAETAHGMGRLPFPGWTQPKESVRYPRLMGCS